VTRMLDRVGTFRGYPKAIRTDQGPVFTSRAGAGHRQQSPKCIPTGRLSENTVAAKQRERRSALFLKF
jgi:transposase InsO family protein